MVINKNAQGFYEALIKIPDDWETPHGGPSRDAGKLFLLTEWPAMRAEKWLWRFGLAITRSRAEIPYDLKGIGWQGLAIIGWNTILRGEVRSEELLPILDELLECARLVRDPNVRNAQTGELIATPILEGDVKEIATVGHLRNQVFMLHTNFSLADSLLKIKEAIFSLESASSTEPASATT